MTQTPEFNSYEQALIDQLRSSPSPEIDPVVADYLRERIFAEADQVWQSPSAAPDALSVDGRSYAMLFAAGVVILILLIVLIVVSRQPAPYSESIEPDATPTETATPTPTASPSPTAPPSPTPTASPSPTATPSPTPTDAAAVPPTAAPEDDLISIIIIEGTVIEATDAFIVVFDVVIELDGLSEPPPPIAPGVTVRVEGVPRVEGSRVIVTATRITIILPTPAPSTRPGQAPPPPPPGGGRSSRSS